ncbi:ABC transporter ATP-binding protein [Anaerolineales bacterium HSG6]|nr:ABC transporter ATP-binding protein [Anaerolineales bacterium HSG6]MDM8529923.1 ABC transporter ATP-binding protein [Anaerolineales bacterium HSG25]
MSTVVRFENVSKKFSIQRTRPRFWQERLFGMFKPKPADEETDKSFWVLRDISFEIEQGESISFIGVNGAGKSTLLKLLTHIIRPTTGTIEINGRISALLELGTGFHPDLTGRENIYLNGSILGLKRTEIKRRMDAIIEFAELARFIDVPVRNYSSGMYVRLGFAVAIYTEPEILIVDEVLAVGDVAFQRKCMDQINALKRRGVTIILVTHAMGSVEDMCQRAVWLDKGRIREIGPSESIVRQYIWDSYEQNPAGSSVATDHVDDEDDDEDENKESPKRWGSGEVTIEQVQLLGADNQPRDYYKTGESMTLAMHYQAKERIEKPVFGIAIHRSDGTHVTGPNTKFAKYKISHIEGNGVVYFTVPALSLLEGTYYVTVVVCDDKTEQMFDYHDQLYPFQMVPWKDEPYGLLTLNGNWKIE